jgi:hypothetical protein
MKFIFLFLSLELSVLLGGVAHAFQRLEEHSHEWQTPFLFIRKSSSSLAYHHFEDANKIAQTRNVC